MLEDNSILKFGKNYLGIINMPTVIAERGIPCAGWHDGQSKTIGINIDLHPLVVLDAIFHELVHHKQYERGDLKAMEIRGVMFNKFKGQIYKVANSAKDHKHYWNLPYEVEARAKAKIMVKLYLKTVNSTVEDYKLVKGR